MTDTMKVRFVVADRSKKKQALNISRLTIYPPVRILMDRKNLVSAYSAHLLKLLTNEHSLKDNMGVIVEIMSLYEETNKEASQVYIRTTDNFISSMQLMADGLNHFYHNNRTIIDNIYQMLYGNTIAPKPLKSDKDLEKAELAATKDDSLSEMMDPA